MFKEAIGLGNKGRKSWAKRLPFAKSAAGSMIDPTMA